MIRLFDRVLKSPPRVARAALDLHSPSSAWVGSGVANLTLSQCKSGIAGRIAQVRGNRSQRRFARDLGVFQQNVNRYESGSTPHVDFLITLALKEKVSLDWLLLGTGTMRRQKRSGSHSRAAR